MKTTSPIFLIVILFCLLSASCGPNNSGSSNSNSKKITFPTVGFTISGSTDTTLFGEQGTRLFIEKETFRFTDGTPVTDSIKIELKEFYKKSDILLANLSTESDGKLLETGGMLNIKATSNGREVEIKSDKQIIVHFPKKPGDYKSMNIFYADQTSTDSSVTNWNVDTVSLFKKTLKLGGFGWWYPAYDDSTEYDFTVKDYVDTGYYWNPIDFYVTSYSFSEQTRKEVMSTMNKNTNANFEDWNDYGVECEMKITADGFIKEPRVNSRVSKETKQEIIQFLNNLPQLEPGKNKYGKIIERRGLLLIQEGDIVPIYKTREEYVKSFNSKYSKYEKNPIKNMDDAELNYYVFSVSKLGWINCDRFMDTGKTTDFIVQAPVNNNTQIKMVFADINGVLMGHADRDNYVFSKVPVGRGVTIFALKNTDGQFQAAFQRLTITDSPLADLPFKEMTLTELKQELEKLN